MAVTADLNLASNLGGPLDGEVRARLHAFIDNPTVEGWDDCHGIILSGETWMTLWQAILEIDPTFPSIGRRTDTGGRIIDDWPRVPTRETVIQAINFATH